MKVFQMKWRSRSGWSSVKKDEDFKRADLIFCFGSREVFEEQNIFEKLKSEYPSAQIVSSSTAGEIFDIDVNDDSISVVILQFDSTTVKSIRKNIKDYSSPYDLGNAVIKELNPYNPKHIFVLFAGETINGSGLVFGMNEAKNNDVIISGGLAGDGYQFKKTIVGLNAIPTEGEIVAIGLCGENLKVGFGARGGWEVMSKTKTITRSEGCVLYELDGQPALKVYKKYLGNAAFELPASALSYPLLTKENEEEEIGVIRAVLSIDEEQQSMTFAGDVPEGYMIQLMRCNQDMLIDCAAEAAGSALSNSVNESPDLALIVSCVGRKIVLGQNIDEEVEKVKDRLGAKTVISGFYAYGEIGPKFNSHDCELYNETIAITTFKED